jgi:hypothetical protein
VIDVAVREPKVRRPMKQKESRTSRSRQRLACLHNDFATWCKRFDERLQVDSDAWKAFCHWKRQTEDYHRLFMEWTDSDTLQQLHERTLPEVFSDADWKRNRYTAKALSDLALHLHAVNHHLRTVNNKIILRGVSLKLSDMLQNAEKGTNDVLKLLSDPLTREPDVIDQALGLLIVLDGVPEKEAFALVKVAMRAHGYSDDDLVMFDIEQRRAGLVRKRLKSFTERFTTALFSMRPIKYPTM